MKYSLSFKLIKLNPQEVKCSYNLLGKLVDIIEKHPNIRYNIQLNDKIIPKDFEKQIEYIKAKGVDYTIGCRNINVIQELISKGYNAYCVYPVTDWEMFRNFQSIGVTDIVIDGPLGFQINKIKENKMNTYIRVIPNCSHNATFLNEENIDSFFIRPEDLKLYKDTIDFIEFDTSDIAIEETIFNIYKKESFNGTLRTLIKQVNSSVPNSLIHAKFGELRLNCQQKCKENGKCHLCKSYVKVTQLVNEYLSSYN